MTNIMSPAHEVDENYIQCLKKITFDRLKNFECVYFSHSTFVLYPAIEHLIERLLQAQYICYKTVDVIDGDTVWEFSRQEEKPK